MATEKRDYYEVLGIPRDADRKAVKDAFRTLALRYHPDRNKKPGAEERFKEIAEAYAVLSDPKKRAEYDARGFAGVAGFSPEDLFGGIDFEDVFGGSGFGLDLDFGPGGLFERFFRRRRAGPPRGANIEVEIALPLERVDAGGEEKIRFTRPETCLACHGSGAAPDSPPRPCAACDGSGRQTKSRREGGVTFQQISVCPVCRGQGRIVEHPCPVCGGSGETQREETLGVTIPVGVEEGMVLRIPGRGLPSRETGGTPGDLLLVVHSVPDPRFQRAGADLWRGETLSVSDAVLGAQIQVPTLGQPATVTIPPGTQPDTVLRLRGKGLPEYGGKGRGDLLLRVQVRVPERLSKEQRVLYGRLRALGD